MESINNFIAQLRDLFRSMTPAARGTAGLLIAAVVVSMGYLFFGGGNEAEHYLFGGTPLPPSEVQSIEAALSADSIPFDTSGNRVRVAAPRQYEAMAAIAAAGAMPLNLHDVMTKALDSGSFLEGREQTRERLEVAKEQYLARVIRSMPWVEDAAVSFEEKPSKGLHGKDDVTAAVAITPVAGKELNPLDARVLKKLTASWFGRGLTPDNVDVTDLHGGSAAYGSDSLALAELADTPYFRSLFLYEESVRSKIVSQLAYIPGLHVEVHAQLAPQTASETFSREPAQKGTTLRSNTEVETTKNMTGSPSGRTGLAAQGPDAAPPNETSPSTESSTTIERDENDYDVGVKTETVQVAGLTPEDVQATIHIPMNWLIETVWKNQWRRTNNKPDEQNVPMPTGQEMQALTEAQENQIQTDIENLFPDTSAGEDPFPRVQVSFYEASDPAPIPEPSLTETAAAWTTAHWGTLFMFGLAAASLVMLRSMVKSAGKIPAAERPALKLDLPEAAHEPNGDEERDEDDRPRLRLNKGPTLKDDLAQLVREDPDTAATILRAWISRAA